MRPLIQLLQTVSIATKFTAATFICICLSFVFRCSPLLPIGLAALSLTIAWTAVAGTAVYLPPVQPWRESSLFASSIWKVARLTASAVVLGFSAFYGAAIAQALNLASSRNHDLAGPQVQKLLESSVMQIVGLLGIGIAICAPFYCWITFRGIQVVERQAAATKFSQHFGSSVNSLIFGSKPHPTSMDSLGSQRLHALVCAFAEDFTRPKASFFLSIASVAFIVLCPSAFAADHHLLWHQLTALGRV